MGLKVLSKKLIQKNRNKVMEEGRFSFFKFSRFRPVSLTLLRALILALRRNCCIKVTWGCKRETIILSSLKHLLSFYHGGQDFGQIVPTRSDLRIVPL